MKKLLAIATIIIISTFAVFAQTSRDEQEILKIDRDYNQASLKNDVAFFERVLADDYIYSGPAGKALNRAQYLEQVRNEAAKPTYKLLEITSSETKLKIVGNTAFLTAGWTSLTAPLNDSKTEPHKDNGRYTTLYEKRGGLWLIVAEHVSEAQHDRKLMEQQVLKAGQEYAQMIENNDDAAIGRILADEYIYTDYKGKIRNRAEGVTSYRQDRGNLESVEIFDQKARITGNGSAVETGTISFKGGVKGGKTFDIRERYTTTWIWRDFRWQIVADHVSEIQ